MKKKLIPKLPNKKCRNGSFGSVTMVPNRNSKDYFLHWNKHQNANHGFFIHLNGYAIELKNKENTNIMRYF